MSDNKAVVGVVMGSNSDMPVMEACVAKLKDFGLSCEVRVISAHRTPDIAHEYASTARDRGLKIIIAAAGMSAALGGVLAANTTLPVIGVPMISGPLGGMDAALSTMQMPPGIPVASMAIGKPGAINAAIFAAEILGVSCEKMAGELATHKTQMAEKVQKADQEIQEG